MRGRRPDPPALQAAKGDPGRRKGKRLAAEAKVKAAEPLASDASPADPAKPYATKAEPPAILLVGQHAEALKVWNELGPELERTNRLAPIHCQTFAMFCFAIAEYWACERDIAENGFSQTVPTIAAGGQMERDRPVLRRRNEAFSKVMEGAKHFGLTPREEFSIFKDQAVVVRESPGLFNRTGVAPSAANDADPAAVKPPAPAASSAGMLGRMAGAPPARPH